MEAMAAKPTLMSTSPDMASHFFERAPSPMAATEGARHSVRYANPAFCRLVDKSTEQLLGKSLCEILPNERDCMMLLDRVYHSGNAESHSTEEHDEPHPVLLSYTIWPVNADEGPAGIVIQVTETARLHKEAIAMNEALLLSSVRQHELTDAADTLNSKLQIEILERIQAEEALQRSQEQLSNHAGKLEGLVIERTSALTTTNEQLEAFVYSIAHDLRAPLRAIQGFSELLVEEAGETLNTVGKRYAARISKSAQFMDALLRDLLAFSRISQQHVILSSVNLQSVVAAMLTGLQANIEENNATVESTGPWPEVLAHEPTLVQVLVNLISNALKFVEPGVSPRVRLRAEQRAEFIRVWVEDNGIGIAPEYQEQIFGVFTRLNAEQYRGTGIGLAIVQKGVERMGGQVGVESAPQQGSRFWFELRKA
jgi:signal transduction histidine kinase